MTRLACNKCVIILLRDTFQAASSLHLRLRGAREGREQGFRPHASSNQLKNTSPLLDDAVLFHGHSNGCSLHDPPPDTSTASSISTNPLSTPVSHATSQESRSSNFLSDRSFGIGKRDQHTRSDSSASCPFSTSQSSPSRNLPSSANEFASGRKEDSATECPVLGTQRLLFVPNPDLDLEEDACHDACAILDAAAYRRSASPTYALA